MKKRFICIFSVLLCAAMLLCAVPAVSAEPLEGKKLPQQQSIYYDESGEIYFTTADELTALALEIEKYPDVYFSCNYECTDALVISRNLTIPKNMFVYCYTGSSGKVQIEPGVTAVVNGFLGAAEFDIQGNITVAESGGLGVSSALKITGQMNLEGYVNVLKGTKTALTGLDKINYGAQSYVWMINGYSSETELRQLFAAASEKPANWIYDCYNAVNTIHLTQPLTVPSNGYLCLDICDTGDEITLTGAPITVLGEIDVYTSAVIKNDLIIADGGCLYAEDTDSDATVVLSGKVTCDGDIDLMDNTTIKGDLTLGDGCWLYAAAPLTLEGKVTNLGVIDFYYGDGNPLTIKQADSYDDGPQDDSGYIYINGWDSTIPSGVLVGPELNKFDVQYYPSDGLGEPYWRLSNYGSKTQTGLPADKPIDPTASVIPMYRLYNPNSGEHFYTGSGQECNMLANAGWQYEGIAWNAPTKSGAPVYRLYNPNNGDHHYTMSTEERDMLVGYGWQYEGIAWNSADSKDPNAMSLLRLYNPNADCGSHHYTGSLEEKEMLVAAGWIYEGIGWYGLVK